MQVDLRATYRVQLRPEFGFTAAAARVDYLDKLGISHLYCSPYLQAAPGSTHGYDVVNPNQLNDELGGESAHHRLCQTLASHNMSQVLDIVPNHMAITGPENPWWWDVLENGPSSQYAAYFDVEWDPPEARHSNLVMLPVLGDHYGRVLESGELVLHHQEGEFTLHYHEHTFPLAPRSVAPLLEKAARKCRSEDLGFIASALWHLPEATATDRKSIQQRHRDKEVLRKQLVRLCEENTKIVAVIDAIVDDINAHPDALDELVGMQNYRIALWRMAEHELGYRRFFNINTLVGLNVDDKQVFDDSHNQIKKLVRKGVIDGLRIDHPDGLYDPESYFHRLRQTCPDTWIVAEKILEHDEQLRSSWPIAGTTGYDFMNLVNGLFVAPWGEKPLTGLWQEKSGEDISYEEMVYRKKYVVMERILGSDVNRLTSLLLDVCENHRRHRDYARYQLYQAILEVAANFPVYRTYIHADTGRISATDTQQVETALERAKDRRPDLGHEVFEFIGDILLLRLRGESESAFVMRFQQFTAPVMAKGVEDTTFYNYNRLISLNEVGGNPAKWGVAIDEFHQRCVERQQTWPQTMLSTSTHDTKRSEDVRARINLLSEIPEAWRDTVWYWSELNDKHKTNGFPDGNMEYFLYQTLVGAWPIETGRVVAYMEKAVREAKTFTFWTNPYPEYEAALKNFVEAILSDPEFQQALDAFIQPLIEPGRINALAQTLLKLTAPGVPDIYQGTELWDNSLVDPDNRRPVDFDRRRTLLDELDSLSPDAILQRMDEGLPKLSVIRETLALRRRHPEAFGADGTYVPLPATGAKADHVLAFGRGERVIVAAPRFLMSLDEWEDTALDLPAGGWKQIFTGEQIKGGEAVPVWKLFERCPVCVLEYNK